MFKKYKHAIVHNIAQYPNIIMNNSHSTEKNRECAHCLMLKLRVDVSLCVCLCSWKLSIKESQTLSCQEHPPLACVNTLSVLDVSVCFGTDCTCCSSSAADAAKAAAPTTKCIHNEHPFTHAFRHSAHKHRTQTQPGVREIVCEKMRTLNCIRSSAGWEAHWDDVMMGGVWVLVI